MLTLFVPSALAFTPGLGCTPARSVAGRAVVPPVCSVDVASLDPSVLAGGAAAAVVVLGGGVFALSKKDDIPPAPLPTPPTPATETAPPPPPAPQDWPLRGGGGGTHRAAGRWPKPAARELWTPPPGWTPPTKPVSSWYDRGIRLASAAPAEPVAAPPAAPPAPPAAPPSFKSKLKRFFGSRATLL